MPSHCLFIKYDEANQFGLSVTPKPYYLIIMSSQLISPLNSTARSCTSRPRLIANTQAPRLAVQRPTRQTQPTESCVPRLVTAQAAAAPDAPALFAGAEMMSYEQLCDRANQVANYLIELGVDPDKETGSEDIVAICLDRSITGVTCALGALTAGSAYLPLDPSYPTERLNFMLSDAQPRVLITTQNIAERLPTGRWRVVVIDRDFAEIDRRPTVAPEVKLAADRLAYVIYTSGSTGRPKGVEITHASLMNLVLWHQQTFEVTSEDRASLLAGVGFDAAVWESWPYLAAGASLHLPEDATRLSPDLLRDWFVSERITIGFLPTALAERVMTLDWPPETALRTLLTGAEMLRQFPSDDLPFRVINNYGPTECTVVATSGQVPHDVYTDGRPTIGRPIANTQIYILDEDMQPVPDHAAGEIYVGGAAVARGYLNRQELTLERFVKDPFSNDPSARLYRTGDLARYLANGEIAYLGRIDEQIKILGHRIEPNEIVSVLDRHPLIESSLVLAHEETCREKHLIAYVVLHPESQTSAADLHSFLEKELPQYMIPAVFVRVETMPLTQNGKVDRAALPLPNSENTLRNEEFTAPRTPVEERLAVMLSALLGIEQVSVHDNFFMLGGHSLLGTQLISQIRGAFGVELALRTLFESPTIEQLSQEIERLVMAQVEAMSEDEVLRLLA
jgi:amino acid adenylation domain-containing protein